MDSRSHLRVLYVYGAAGLSGASWSLLDLLSGLDREQVEPTVLLPKQGALMRKINELDIACHIIPFFADSKPHSYGKVFLKRILAPLLQHRVDAFVRDGCFDLVHVNSLLSLAGARAARRAGIPYVCHAREFVREDHGVEFMDEAGVRGILADASALIYISRAVERKFAPWTRGVTSKVMYNAIDRGRYAANHAPLLSAGEPCRMLLAGRIVPSKGQLDAVHAMEVLRFRGVNAELTLVGNAENVAYRDACLSYISEHGLSNHVRILDFHDDLAALRAETDIALVCSRSEAMGRVTVECMMAGCLVVGADAGATPELVRDGDTGLLYRAGDPGSLADCVEWAVRNPREARAVAERGKRWAMGPTFDKGAYVERVTGLYEEVLARAKMFKGSASPPSSTS